MFCFNLLRELSSRPQFLSSEYLSKLEKLSEKLEPVRANDKSSLCCSLMPQSLKTVLLLLLHVSAVTSAGTGQDGKLLLSAQETASTVLLISRDSPMTLTASLEERTADIQRQSSGNANHQIELDKHQAEYSSFNNTS